MDINKMETQGIDPTLRGIQKKEISGGASSSVSSNGSLSKQSKQAQGLGGVDSSAEINYRSALSKLEPYKSGDVYNIEEYAKAQRLAGVPNSEILRIIKDAGYGEDAIDIIRNSLPPSETVVTAETEVGRILNEKTQTIGANNMDGQGLWQYEGWNATSHQPIITYNQEKIDKFWEKYGKSIMLC
jgi:hypothetical protein